MRRFLWLTPALLLLAGPTAPATSASSAVVPAVTVVAVGDIACAPGARVTATTCRQAATAKLAAAQKPNRVIALGDLQYPKGSYSDFVNSYAKSWGALKSVTMPVVGNHEYETPGAAGFFRYFKDRNPGTGGYFRRVINGWQIFVLNSNCDKVSCAAQRTWLDKGLAAYPSTCSIIATHHPRFSSGKEHGSAVSMKPFWQIAYRHHVDIALSGHDHDYERFTPMDPNGIPVSGGIRQFVSGAGGKSLYAMGTKVPGSQKFLGSRFGVLKLTLRPTNYSWQFIGLGGSVLDSGTSACH